MGKMLLAATFADLFDRWNVTLSKILISDEVESTCNTSASHVSGCQHINVASNSPDGGHVKKKACI